ncbi:primosomal protein N' [Nonomuraea sp. NPDC050663]|uniref:primosomal protein N' n=1 Tax=Nonomuraea sp. NPDC050663 TaxID=3364370 RepID=UPI003798DFAB
MTDDALLPLEAVRGKTSAKGAVVAAERLPVARVAVDNPLPHLDRTFDYLVPQTLDDVARPGVRVRVRFAGKLTDGYLLERVERSDHEGRLTPLERVISPEVVLTPEIAGLARGVADRYAGTLADVLRLAVPPRHARVETEAAKQAPKQDAGRGVSAPVASHPAAPAANDDAASLAAASLAPASSALPASTAPTSGSAPTSASTGPASTGPASTGPASTGPASTGPASTAPSGDASGEAGDLGRDEGRGQGTGSDAAASGGAGETAESGAEASVAEGPSAEGAAEASAWDEYPMGPSFLDALEHGRAPRAVWNALPGRCWARPVAEAVRATLAGGRGAVVVVPDGKDVAYLDEVLTEHLGPGRHVALTAQLGPAERYRRWLKVLRGEVRAVVGTRAAAFAPVVELGLAAIWDDGDDLHAERLAPYPHAREVLALRAHRTGAAMLIGGHARTAEATQLVATGWARQIVARRETIRAVAPRVRPAGEDAELAKDQAARAARLPSLAWKVLKEGLEQGPVLIQVPRRGYVPVIACQHCRAPARCNQPPTRQSRQEPGGRQELGGRQEPTGRHEQTGRPQSTAAVPGSPSDAPSGSPAALALGLPGLDPDPQRGAARGSGRESGDHGSGGEAAGRRRDEEGGHGAEGDGYALGATPRGEQICHGPLALRAGHAAPYCRWCGRVDAAWRCPACGGGRVRAVVVGARRTAEELGRAFPSVQVKTSGRDGVLATIGSKPALVVATPGAEPSPEGGYAAVVLLDGWSMLGRADLRASEEALRRWMNAAALMRPAAELVIMADAALPVTQALIRWDPITHAERELAERAELGFPPAVRMATLTGGAPALRQMLEETRLPPNAEVLGPVMVGDDQERMMVRVPRQEGAALAAALKGASGVRAARKAPDVVRVSVDPLDLI